MFESLSICQKMGEGCSMFGGTSAYTVVLIPLMIMFSIGMLFLINLALKWLWNITIPDVFGLKKITYWQSFRLLLICAVLFSGAGMIFKL